MKISRRLFARQLLLFALVSLPLVLTIAQVSYLWWKASERQALGDARDLSRQVAIDVEAVLGRAERLLRYWSAQEAVRSLAGPGCEPLLSGAVEIEPLWNNAVVVARDGRVVCTTSRGPGAMPPSLAVTPWFKAASAAEGLYLHSPEIGPISRRSVLIVSLPLPDGAGQRVGLVAVSIDLVRLSETLGQRVDGAGTTVALTADTKAQILARWPDPQRWIGQDASKTASAAGANVRSNPADATRVALGTGLDGSERVIAWTPVRGPRWSAVVTLPLDLAFANARETLRDATVGFVASVAIAFLAALWLTQRTTRPLRNLADTAQAVAAGNRQARADEALPEEFAGVARTFNAMLDAESRSSAEVYAARQQLATTIETALDAIVTVDAAGSIIVFNAAAAAMFQVDARTALGMPLAGFVPGLALPATAGDPTAESGVRSALTGRRADSSEFPLEASMAASGSGPERQITVTLRDTTERLAAERAHEAQVEAEAASRAKTEFLSRISHELRTPLNAMVGFTQLLAEDADAHLSTRQRSQLARIDTAGMHLRALIDDMLDIARVEAGQLRVSDDVVEMASLLEEVVELSVEAAARNSVGIDAGSRSAVAAWVRGDRVRLRQALLNVVSNAVKYNRPGGWVRIDLRVRADRVAIRVLDAGLGMTPEQRAQLFRPFNRLGRERSSIEGSGIGLTLTRHLVELMGGRIRVRSAPGRGTLVVIELQRGAATASEATHAPSARPASSDGPTGLLLYIEDNEVNVLLVQQCLAHWPSLRLVSAPDGATGIAMARDRKPDLVLLDMHLPDMHGRDVLAALQADPATRHLRVVALSASAMQADIDAARAAGALDYWTKPIDVAQLRAGVAQFMAGSERREDQAVGSL